MLLAGGCTTQPPTSSIGQPAVFTALHLQAAQSTYAIDHSGVGVPADLQRYFRSTPDEYKKQKLRIDAMLDNVQRRRAIAQSVISRLDLELKLLADAAASDRTTSALVKPASSQQPSPSSGSSAAGASAGAGAAPATPASANADAPTDGQAKKIDPNARLAAALEAVKAQLVEATSAVPEDSLFDSLDRAADAYTAYLLKSLRLYGVDSRVIPPGPLYQVLRAQEEVAVAEANAKAQIMVPTALGSVATFRASLRAQALAAQMPRSSHAAVGPTQSGSAAVAGAAAATTEAANSALAVFEVPRVPELFPPRSSPTPMRPGSIRASENISLSARQLSVSSGGASGASTLFSEEQWAKLTPEQRTIALESWKSVNLAEINAADKANAARLEAVKANADAVAAVKEFEAQERAHQEKMSRLPATIQREQYAEMEASISRMADDLAAAVTSAEATLEPARSAYASAIEKYNQTVIEARNAALSLPGTEGQRLIMLLLQAHVGPGTQANMMVGVRARIVGFTRSGQWNAVSGGAANLPISVVRVHPTRNYDIEDQVFAEQLSEQAALSAAGKLTSQVEAGLARDLASEAAERRRFLSRIPKMCSFVDAANAEFGWDFFPSNLVVSKRSVLERAGGLVASQLATAYKVDAYLEGGARDCAVFLVLPTDVESLTLEVEHVTASLEIGSQHRYTVFSDASRAPARGSANRSRMVVTLPRFDTREWAAVVGRLAAPAPVSAVGADGTGTSKPGGKD
jgi:hypothetical protein